VEADSIIAQAIYPDSIFDNLIRGLMILRQTGDVELYMELFGTFTNRLQK
jgi:hypothetical protein